MPLAVFDIEGVLRTQIAASTEITV